MKTCKECGKEIDKYWSDHKDLELCRTCDFWASKIDIEDDPHIVRVNGHHYTIREEDVPEFEKGSCGDKFSIKFFDGRIVSTTNLWCQGEIPERFRKRLPDNAEFIADNITDNLIIKIPIKRLHEIAEYYQFPVAVFFTETPLRGKRKDNIKKQWQELKKKLSDIIDEYL